MNNTYCLGIFLLMIWYNDLDWQYTCETVGMLLTELVVAWYATRKQIFLLFDATVILMLYPLNLLFVYCGHQLGIS